MFREPCLTHALVPPLRMKSFQFSISTFFLASLLEHLLYACTVPCLGTALFPCSVRPRISSQSPAHLHDFSCLNSEGVSRWTGRAGLAHRGCNISSPRVRRRW